MGGYTVLANRYRPRRFDDVVGQEDTARVLRTALSTQRAGHAFLFSGPRGVGKTSMARILAKALNCLSDGQGDPCGTCRICQAIDGPGDCMDVVEIDGASHNKVENVRDLIENLRFRPVEARYRIYIVDEVHMLSTAAFNALLKTLEEPPAHAKFILATTEPLKVPETIRSRCQMFDFRRLTTVAIRDRLATVCEAEGVPAEAELLERLARHAQGGLRDALSLLDQLITFGEGRPNLADFERLTGRLSPELLQRLLSAALGGDAPAVHAAANDAMDRGARPADLVGQVTEQLEGLLVLVAGAMPADRTEAEVAALKDLAAHANLDQVLAMLDVALEASQRLKQRHDGRLVVEMAMLTLARLPAMQSVADLLAGAEGSPPSGGAPPGSEQAAAPTARPRRRSEKAPSRPGRRGSDPQAVRRQPAAEAGAGASTEGSDAWSSSGQPQPAAADDPRSRFLAAIGSRSLRLELVRYQDIRQQGGELILVPPADGAEPIFDTSQHPEVLSTLSEAARRVFGAQVRVRVEAPEQRPARPGPGAASPGQGGHPAPGKVDKRVQEEWPGAEKVDL